MDDIPWLLPRDSYAPMVAILMALLQVLEVPVSWRKLRLSVSLKYLGWLLSLESGAGCFRASMLEDKTLQIMRSIAWWIIRPRSVNRRELRQFVGLLVWAAQVNLALRPFLAPLFSAIHKPCSRLQLLALPQLEELRAIMDYDSFDGVEGCKALGHSERLETGGGGQARCGRWAQPERRSKAALL